MQLQCVAGFSHAVIKHEKMEHEGADANTCEVCREVKKAIVVWHKASLRREREEGGTEEKTE